MSRKARAYALFPAVGFVLLGVYVLATDAAKFGWNDVVLLAARGAGAGTFGAIVGLIVAWLVTRKPQ